MNIKVLGEGEVLRDASRVLLHHLEPAKVVRFWASWQMGQGDYLAWRDQQFDKETVDSLYDKVYAFQQKQEQ